MEKVLIQLFRCLHTRSAGLAVVLLEREVTLTRLNYTWFVITTAVINVITRNYRPPLRITRNASDSQYV